MSSPLSGFTAIPNPQMLAFMPIQSYLMMYFAGAGWQIGKRKVSAIPNDKFNPMSANDLLKGFTADLRGSIPTLERSLQDITPLIKTLVEQYGDFALELIKETPKQVEKVGKGIFEELTDIGEGSALDRLLHFIEEDKKKNPPTTGPLAFAHEAEEEIETIKLKTAVAGATVTGKEAPTNLVPYKGKWYTVKRLQQLINAQSGASERLIQRNIEPAAHIIDRSRSNVSMQSLRIEKSRLLANVKNTLRTRAQLLRNRALQGQRRINEIKRINVSVQSARQALANFNRMHGARF